VQIKNKEVAGIRTYIEETVHELAHKVSWPTWEELQKSSIIVLITSVLIALAVWVMDYAFGIWPGDWKGLLGFYYDFINPAKEVVTQ